MLRLIGEERQRRLVEDVEHQHVDGRVARELEDLRGASDVCLVPSSGNKTPRIRRAGARARRHEDHGLLDRADKLERSRAQRLRLGRLVPRAEHERRDVAARARLGE